MKVAASSARMAMNHIDFLLKKETTKAKNISHSPPERTRGKRKQPGSSGKILVSSIGYDEDFMAGSSLVVSQFPGINLRTGQFCLRQGMQYAHPFISLVEKEVLSNGRARQGPSFCSK